MSTIGGLLSEALTDGEGILRLAPNWVPRPMTRPGGRLKLAPEDLYCLGKDRGGICERWFASTTRADNGPGTPEDEGLSYIVVDRGGGKERILFAEAISEQGARLLGEDIMEEHGGWMAYSKFFDNQGPLPHHVHPGDAFAAGVGAFGKPEAYYFPRQLNMTRGDFPYTFFGLQPGTTQEEVLECLERFDEGDNGILDLSQAYRLQPGTGWNVPAGLLHAPGSLLTYEPQRASDVFSMFQSQVEGIPIDKEMLYKDVPEEYHGDTGYLLNMLDWEANVDPYLAQKRHLVPCPVKGEHRMEEEGYLESWVVYGSPHFSARELTVLPGRSVTLKDCAAYGAIVVQGHGRMGPLQVESPSLIHYGDLTGDEVFVTIGAARRGVEITNESETDELVMLKHYGPGHPDVPTLDA